MCIVELLSGKKIVFLNVPHTSQLFIKHVLKSVFRIAPGRRFVKANVKVFSMARQWCNCKIWRRNGETLVALSKRAKAH